MAKPYRPRRWRPALPDPAACLLLSKTLDLSPVTAQVLYNRGLATPEAAHAFLTAGRDQILDPFLLKDMDRAVRIIRQRLADGGPIMVYGDYDVDGVTGTTILVLALRALGAAVEYYIPNRFSEGYGLNVAALQEIRQRGHDFVISVDTGVSAVAEAEAAKAMGMTLLVSDHHEPGPTLPDVPALVNPKRPDCAYPFKGLSGVGVAFKLALALETPGVWELLDIVTLGTIADMVPLVGENRAIVREGLAALGNTRRPGLRALMDVCGIKQPVTATHIAFALGPRINALGRMGSAMAGVDLLTTNDLGRAYELARHLDAENQSRQEVEGAILQEALAQAERLPADQREYVLVLAGEGWHHGVVGICASRVLEAYHRPSILLSIDGDQVRGSARSIPAFHMHRALLATSDLFSKFGGHAMAAGMTLKRREDVAVLRERLNALGQAWLRPEDLVPELSVDAYIGLGQVTEAFLGELHSLEPHGIGNPTPLFAVRDLTVADCRTMGKEEQHLRLLLKGQGTALEAVGWNLAPARPDPTALVQVAGFPEMDTYQGRSRLRLTLRDVQVIRSMGDRGFPVNVAVQPELSAGACLAWDPLEGLVASPRPSAAWVVDARGERLAAALESLNGAHAEVAAAAEVDESDHESPAPTRRIYLEALAQPAGSRILVRVCSPWAAAALAADLQGAAPMLRERVLLWLPGQPEPAGGSIIVAPYGSEARGEYGDIALYHPPYHFGHVPTHGRVHLLWEPDDWELNETALGWPYPDRDLLVQAYKQMKAGNMSATALTDSLGELPGPWNQLRLDSALDVFREMGVLTASGVLNGSNGAGGKFQLEASARYTLGTRGRTVLAQLNAHDWPESFQRL